MVKKNLLLVDADPQNLRIVEVSLRNAGFSVTTAQNGAEAMAKVEAVRPALVLTDTHMPVLNGYQLCERLKADPQLKKIPLIFLSTEDSLEARVKGLKLGAEEFLHKPIYIKELITRVKITLQRLERERLQRKDTQRFFGSLESMSVVDLLQSMNQGKRSCLMLFEHEGRSGRVWFQDGEVLDAEVGQRSGEEAIYRLLTWEQAHFEIQFQSPDRPRAIYSSVQLLLMEGMRRVDEWGRMCEQLPPLSTVFRVDYTELAERLAELPPEINDLLRLFDGHRDALQAIDDAELSDLEGLASVSRLFFEGILYEVGRALEAPTPPREPERLEEWLAKPSSEDPGVEEAALESEEPESASPGEELGPERDLVDDLLASAHDLPAEVGAFAPETEGFEDEEDFLFDPEADDIEDLPEEIVALPEPAPESLFEPELLPELSPLPDEVPLPEAPHLDEEDEERVFFERPAEEIEALDDHDLHPPVSRVSQITFGVLALIILTGMGFFGLRDKVEDRKAPIPNLDSSWYSRILEKRPQPTAMPPLDASWTLPQRDGGLRVEIPEKPSEEPKQPSAELPKLLPAPDRSASQQGRIEALLKEGLQLHKQGKFKRAIDRFEQALGSAPDDPRLLLGFAKALLEDKQDADALRAAQRLAQREPKNARAQLLIGEAQQNLGKREGAVEAYDRYLKLAPRGQYAEDVRRVLQGIR